jgi:hypothetical protein
MDSDAPRLSSDLRHLRIYDMFECWESQRFVMNTSTCRYNQKGFPHTCKRRGTISAVSLTACNAIFLQQRSRLTQLDSHPSPIR